jgi:virulence-associated protein VapD
MSLQVKDYTLVEKLGSGSYSTVYKGFKKVCTKNRFEWRAFSVFFSEDGSSKSLRNVSNQILEYTVL